MLSENCFFLLKMLWRIFWKQKRSTLVFFGALSSFAFFNPYWWNCVQDGYPPKVLDNLLYKNSFSSTAALLLACCITFSLVHLFGCCLKELNYIVCWSKCFPSLPKRFLCFWPAMVSSNLWWVERKICFQLLAAVRDHSVTVSANFINSLLGLCFSWIFFFFLRFNLETLAVKQWFDTKK